MDTLLIIIGVLLVAGATTDALWTTLGLGGAGPLTDRLSQGVWTAVLRVHRLRPSHALLQASGTVILVAAIVMWVLLLWAGWMCLYSADPSSILHAQTNAPASFWSRVYFTGFTVFTLGIGDYVPQGEVWEVATALASFNGLFLVTLAITYLVPVVSAAVAKHQLGGAIFGLGDTPQEILLNAWDGARFEGLDQHLAQLSSQIGLHAERHLAYPVLHYFHSTRRQTAAAPALATLFETLLLLTEGVAPEVRPLDIQTRPALQALQELLHILEIQHLAPVDSAPPPPPREALRTAGIPLVETETFEQAVENRNEERKLLRAYVEQEGWSWKDLRG